MFKKIILGVTLIVQLIILCISFMTFTSTIQIFPWYEPLTMGAMFVVVGLIPIQLIISIVFFILYIINKKLKKFNIVSISNLCILTSMIAIPIMYEPLFYLLALIYSIIEPILVVILLKISIESYKN